jgi:inositol hexakisphosphate/diphosphoinositol-pentakisphosphate kinase
MPDKPLVLLYQLVDLMKVLVDQLRQKCLDERVDATPALRHSISDSKSEAAAGGDKAAGGEKAGSEAKAGGLQHSSSARGISSSRYSSLASSPDDWRLDETKPCSGERLLLMFDRWVGAHG